MIQPSSDRQRVTAPKIAGLPAARSARAIVAIAGLAALGGLGGCNADSYLWDRSQIGRWERTPTTIPILSRIAAIEGPEDEFLQISEVTPDDLIPEIAAYRVGPGDEIEISILDFPEVGAATPFRVLVDQRGLVMLPQLGEIYVSGRSLEELRETVEAAMVAADIDEDPLVDVRLMSQRQQRFNIVGGVASPGAYFIPEANYRLYEALAAAGGFSERASAVYVIRQVPLTEEAAGRPRAPQGTVPPPAPGAGGEELIDIIDELTQPGAGEQPADAPPPQDQPPAIDLVEPGQPGAAADQPPATTPEGTWVFLNGRWVLVRRDTPALASSAVNVPGAPPLPLYTQRVIRIPMEALVSGHSLYNIVIRPGDIIRVPPRPDTNVFVGGQVARPGAYALDDELTLQRVIVAAGGLGTLAVPDRCDLVRMVGPNRQAIIRLNLRAIAEGTQPDVFLKANDMINIGTDFWALPLAVIRNGFRATYGFGFLLDRNFGNDVFGAPPIDDTSGPFFF